MDEEIKGVDSLSDIRATVLLADYATVANGKLTAIGCGWNIMSGPSPFALAAIFEIPWQMTNTKHSFVFDLVDFDERPVLNEAGEPLEIRGDFEVGRPPGLRPGSPLLMPVAFNNAPLSLPAGSRFSWRLHINGKTDSAWRQVFSTVSAS